MPGIRIITDSACDIPAELVASSGITVVPLSIRFGDEEFTDLVDLSPADFWAKCKVSSNLPETAAPSPGSFKAAYDAAKDAGADGVVCITISSELSGTYQAAVAAADATEGFDVRVIDSQAVTMAQGLLVLSAADRANSGGSIDDVLATIDANINRVGVLGTLDTLEHLKKGGRVSGAQALLGSVLAIKPMLQLEGGKVTEAGRTRTRAKAIAQLAALAAERAPFAKLAVVHGAADDLNDLLAKLEGIETDAPLIVGDIGSVVGTHGGPGIIGICWLARA
ncbi:MAG: DegV family protein [Actinomycetes bacterium]